MGDRHGKFLQAPLSVGNLDAEQVLLVAVERFAFQIFVGAISQRHGGARQYILDPAAEASLLVLRGIQLVCDGFQNGAHPQPVSFSVPIGRTRLKNLIPKVGLEIVRRSPQKTLKHLVMPGPKPRP